MKLNDGLLAAKDEPDVPESVTGDNPVPEQPAQYENIYEVPVEWRTYRSARLSVGQINEIMRDAYNAKVKAGDSELPDLGGARERFEKKHTIVDGFWVEKSEAKGDND